MKLEKYIPTYTIDSIFDLDPKSVKKLGFNYVLSDLDNTLNCYLDDTPSLKVKNTIKAFQNADINFIIISNNNKKRVTKYCQSLNCPFIYTLLKPLTFRLNWFLKKHKINKNECLIIGDQLFTDIALANNIKIKSLLVKPLTQKDQKFTTYRRKKEKKLFKMLIEQNKLKPWIQ